LFHDISAYVEEIPLILNRNKSAFRAVIHGDLQWFGKRTHRLDVSLHTHIAEYKERWTHGRFTQGRTTRDEECNTKFSFDTVTEKIDYLNMQVRYVKVAGNCDVGLLRLEVAERAQDGFLYGTADAASELQLPRPTGLYRVEISVSRPTVPSDVTPAL
jgi:hypothetical protein